MAGQYQTIILAKEEIAGYCRLRLAAPALAAEARPGQFVQVRCGATSDPLLRRPLSLHGIDRGRGEVVLLFNVTGRGTELLSRKEPGETVDLIGPLGNGFRIDPAIRRAVVVGGGIGIAPFPPLLEELAAGGTDVTALAGMRTAALLPLCRWLRQPGVKFREATDDGSCGYAGTVTGLLEELLAAGGTELIYACGPRGMLREVARLADRYGVPAQVSLEERMGCGLGACLSCVCQVKTAEGFAHKRVCQDGPVFAAAEVVWDE
ncbi:MAG: dihydroorotate dehydrogenase electron transfer subunit [bacterium]|jgi:dihydroorotate dehydrogenase electron transfer subunit